MKLLNYYNMCLCIFMLTKRKGTGNVNRSYITAFLVFCSHLVTRQETNIGSVEAVSKYIWVA